MTIGISKERLIEIRQEAMDSGDEQMSLCIDKLLSFDCTELNPWLPIEQSPKDRTLWGFVDGKKRLIRWGKTSHIPMYGFCLADQGIEDFDICAPTHYQELPGDPE